MGAMATTAVNAVFTGDASLRTRPMKRVTRATDEFRRRVHCARGWLMPVTLRGAQRPICVDTE